MLKAGRVRVKLEPLTEDEVIAAKPAPVIRDTIKPKPVIKVKPPEKKPDTVAVNNKYGIQVNAFEDKKNIKHELVILHKKGYYNILTIEGVYKRLNVTKVIIGPYDTKSGANTALEKVLGNGFKAAFVVKL